jgi:hypothetical protein
MDLQKKVKTALDETRMLILGGEILLGFGLRGVFADGFDQLPSHARYLDAAGLGLMVIVIGLLILPEPYHRIVEGGSDSGAFHGLVTDVADLALVPFALALGIDLYLAAERVLGTTAASAAGTVGAGLALALWYGLPRTRRQTKGEGERAMANRQRHERPETPLHTKIDQLLTEARVILPGAQALFGFQLSIVLTQAFERLPATSRIAHAISIAFVAVSVMLLMAPAAYHRIVYAGEDSDDMHRTGSVLITAATLPLAIGLAVDIHVVMAKIADSGIAGLISGVAALVLLLGLWYGFPLVMAARGERRGAPPKPQGQSG